MFIHSFTADPYRFFLREKYESGLRPAIAFVIILSLLFFLSMAHLLVLFLLSGQPIDAIFLLKSLLFNISLYLSLLLFFGVVVHFVLGSGARLRTTFAVFAYSLIPVLLLKPLIYSMNIFNISWVTDPEVFSTNNILLFWMLFFSLFFSLKIYIKGLSLVHRASEFRIAAYIVIVVLSSAAILWLLKIPFSSYLMVL